MSASFVEFIVEEDSLRDLFKFECSWSAGGQYLAVSTFGKDQGGTVILLSESGNILEADQLAQKSIACKANSRINHLQWHPKLPIVACCWENQTLGTFAIKPSQQRWIYNEFEPEQAEEKSQDKFESSLSRPRLKSALLNPFRMVGMIWMNEGEELFTVSNSGHIQVFDYRITVNQMQKRFSEKLNEFITDAVVSHAVRESLVYVGCRSGIVFQFSGGRRQLSEIIQLEHGVRKLLLYARKLRLIIITDEFQLCQFSVANDEVAEISKIKLASLSKPIQINTKQPSSRFPSAGVTSTIRTGNELAALLIDEVSGVLAVCVFGERLIRLFQVDTGQNLAVLVIDSSDYHWAGVSALLFGNESHLLVAGTSNNRVIIWQREFESNKDRTVDNTESDGNQIQFFKVGEIKGHGSVHHLAISSQSKIAFTSGQSDLSFIESQVLKSAYSHNLVTIQTAAKQLQLIWLSSMQSQLSTVDCQIKDVLIGSDSSYLAIRSNFPKNVHLYECSVDFQLRKCLNVTVTSNAFALNKDCFWYLSQPTGMSGSESTNIQTSGISLNCIRLSGINEEYINPISLKELQSKSTGVSIVSFELAGDHLLLLFKVQNVAQYAYFVYNLQQRQQAQLLNGPILLQPDQQILTGRISSDGKLIALASVDCLWLLQAGTSGPLVWIQLVQMTPESRIYFAQNETRMLLVQNNETELHVLLCWLQQQTPITTNINLSSATGNAQGNTGKVKYKSYEMRKLGSDTRLLGSNLPFMYFLKDTNPDTSSSLSASVNTASVELQVLNEFEGVEVETISVMLDFLTARQADLNAMIRRIARSGEKDQRLWTNLARIAVKSGDLRMGKYCAARLRWSYVVREVQFELRGGDDSLQNDKNEEEEEAEVEEDDDEDEDNDDTDQESQPSSINNEQILAKRLQKIKEESNQTKSRKSTALAVLATNLGLFDEAEALLRQSGQSAKLVEFYECRNQWQQALKSSERLNQRSVRYEYARFLEEENQDMQTAIEEYERAGCGSTEIPRLLFDLGEQEQLKSYCLYGRIKTSETLKESDANETGISLNDRSQLMRWWAQYSESVGELEEALQAYEQAGDYSNWVRLLCLSGQMERARNALAEHETSAAERAQRNWSKQETSEINNEIETTEMAWERRRSENEIKKRTKAELRSKDAALLHLGRQLESNSPSDAVNCFLACGAVQHALRVCRQHALREQLIKITSQHGSRTEVQDLINQLETELEQLGSDVHDDGLPPTNMYDQNGEAHRQQLLEQLMQLHFRAQNWDNCIRLGLQGRLWTHIRLLLQNEIDKLDDDLDDQRRSNRKQTRSISLQISNETLELALKLLRENEQIVDLVLDLLLLRGEHRNLIRDLIVEYRIRLDETFLIKVNQIFGLNRPGAAKHNGPLLISLAESSLQQGEYLVAAKLFNAAEDRTNAAKALARAGDTQKLINFASIARDKIVYRVAANYLQTLGEGHERTIEQFYRKAGATDELNRFHEINSGNL